MSDASARPRNALGGRFARLLDRLLTDEGSVDESGYYVQNTDWPPNTSTSALSGAKLHETLDHAFDEYYSPAVKSLEKVEVPGNEGTERQ
ncbi:hypothetical protein, partial [Paractinoplanes deccanensis]